MKKRILYIVFVFTALVLGSCELIVDVVTDDSTTEIIYEVNQPLNKIILHADMDMEIAESNDSTITITGPAPILENIKITNNDGALTIDYTKSGSWMYDKPQVQFRMPKIEEIELYAFNNITCTDTLRASNPYIYSDGTGDIYLKINNQKLDIYGENISNFYVSGKTENLSILCMYACSFKGAGLIANNVTVDSYGSNDQIVHPVDSLSCKIRLTGDIYYVSSPAEIIVDTEEGATGRVIYNENYK